MADTNVVAHHGRLKDRQDSSGYLHISARTLDKLVTRGVLKPVRLPGCRRVLFDVGDLDRLIDAGKA